jgi:hypothetical protein
MDTTGLKRAASIGLSLALVACADARKPAPAMAAPAAATATYGPSPTVAAAAPVTTVAPEPHAAPNQCGLDELRGLVGRSRVEIPVPIDPGHRRVLCDTCPRSPEVVAGRQTVLFDARTGLVTSVTCG